VKRVLCSLMLLLAIVPAFAATQTHTFFLSGDATSSGTTCTVTNGACLIFQWDDVTNKITTVFITVAGPKNAQNVQPSLIFNASDSATGFTANQQFFPNADGTAKANTIAVPANQANFFTLQTLANGKVIIVPNSSTFSYTLSWPNN
jgi:hypothetical protein